MHSCVEARPARFHNLNGIACLCSIRFRHCPDSISLNASPHKHHYFVQGSPWTMPVLQVSMSRLTNTTNS